MPTRKPAPQLAAPVVSPGTLQFPWLYYRSATGAIHRWRVWSEGAVVFTEYGQVDGKHQQTPGKVCKAQNVGQSNARSPEVQAVAVAASMHNSKLDRKYALKPEDAAAAKATKPMLAQRFDEREKHIVYPCDAQPKLDGNRANARWEDDKVVLVSRSGVDHYDLPLIQEQLSRLLPPDCELDGELYLHGAHPNTINSWVQKEQPESVTIQYCIYDMPIVYGDESLPWVERKKALVELTKPSAPNLAYIPCQPVNSKADIDKLLELWLAQGYEGVMLRNLAGKYAWGNRSNDLQKVKVFEDGEFEIVGCKEGVGKMAGCAIWRCRDPNGTEFDCAMKVPMEERKKQWEQRVRYYGTVMTVSFFGRFPTGIVRFPRAIRFRSAKDT